MLLLCFTAREAWAQQHVSFIRDAEIESIIRRWSTPVFEAAGLDADAVRIYLVNDPRLNSFVAGGQNVFIHTGLLLRSENANQVIGVIAHETGHIAGGHLARTQEALRNASIESIITTVLGVAAAALGGGKAAGAIFGGGATLAQRSFLQYSVAQEAAADKAALTFLDRTGQSARGLYDFFKILEEEDQLSPSRQDPYLRTHPLTRNRMEAVADFLRHSKYSNAKEPPEYADMHRRMKAKLEGFLWPPEKTLGTYRADDNSIAARDARAIAYYRIPDLKRALPLIDGLIRDEPKNPWFHELKGQMLFENGRGDEALGPYREALKLAPHQPLLEIELARVEIESGDPALNHEALSHLNEAARVEDRNPGVWRLLAIAYGRDNKLGMSALSLAEQGMAEGDYKMAREQATRAAEMLKPGTPGRIRAEDLKASARLAEKDRE
jgi:predicted Zn-dependent protease